MSPDSRRGLRGWEGPFRRVQETPAVTRRTAAVRAAGGSARGARRSQPFSLRDCLRLSVAPVALPLADRRLGGLPAIARQRLPDVDLIGGEAATSVAAGVALVLSAIDSLSVSHATHGCLPATAK